METSNRQGVDLLYCTIYYSSTLCIVLITSTVIPETSSPNNTQDIDHIIKLDDSLLSSISHIIKENLNAL